MFNDSLNNLGSYTSSGLSNDAAFNFLMDKSLRKYHNDVCWHYYSRLIKKGTSIVARPEHYPINDEKTQVIYMPPLLDCGTAKSYDISLILSTIQENLVRKEGKSFVLVAGDFQTYGLMVRFKKENKEHAEWLVPVPGEWHAWVHALMAIHEKWYIVVLQKIVEDDSFCNGTVAEKWDSVEKFNRYKFCYEAFIIGATKFLNELIPQIYWDAPTVLLRAVRRNKGAC